MDYFRLIRRRSWDDAWNAVFDSPVLTVLLAILIFLLSMLIHWYRKGFSHVTDALVVAGEGAVATVLVFAGIFLFHFLYLTPKRIITETENELAAAMDKVAALEESRKSRIDVLCG